MPILKRFQNSLESLPKPSENAKYVVAYSGGVDSHVLLHCCKSLNLPVRALHIHHGLQCAADHWVDHCQDICVALNIPLDVIYVDARKKHRQSPEETARRVRYEALEKNLQPGDCLLTAQHLNDQAETLLLQLFRSAGSAGLAAMPSSKRLGKRQSNSRGNHQAEHLAPRMHLRPLLTSSRLDIEAYADEHSLHWMEDPSNQDVRFDRNFVRLNMLPLLESRWPEISQQLATVASLQSDNLQVLEDMAAIDLANTIKLSEYPTDTGMTIASVFEIISVLSVAGLEKLSSPRRLNLLRYWIKQSTFTALEKSILTRNLLEEIEKTLIRSQHDTKSVVTFSGYECRKFQDNLYLLKPGTSESGENDMTWNPSSPLMLPMSNFQITSIRVTGEGLKESLLNEKLTISFRKGGEQFHPVGRGHSQSLKKLFQEAGVPSWERASIPLLYCGDELVAVIGLWVSKKYAATKKEQGWVIHIDNVTCQ